MIQEFIDRDADYLEWVDKHPEGFVLNMRRSPSPEYLVLHRASCSTISGQRDVGAYTSRDYRKAVALEIAELSWLARKYGRRNGTFSKICMRCAPI